METANVPKNPFTGVFTNFSSISPEHQQVVLNVILNVGNDKMRNEVLSDTNRDNYPHLEWPSKKARSLKKAAKSEKVRRVWMYCNVCICTSRMYVTSYIICLRYT